MRWGLCLIALLVAAPAAAQSMVTSDRIDAVSVTLYRDPERGAGAIDRNWPRGYALVTETRTITLPIGRSTIRFEGVSQGMMPETAIVTGLPRQVNEKNRDARLLSPAALIDAYLKRRVHLRRTNRATGKVTVQDAVIQAGPGGGVVLTTAQGVEALGCSGLPEALSYPGVPADLSARPTLSIETDIAAPATVTVQLSYLSQGFDWSANYVAQIAEDGRTLDLFAWLTVANGGSQGFAAARTQAVAGAPNKEPNAPLPSAPPPALHLQCWPMDITSTHPSRGGGPSPPPPPPPPMAAYAEDIIVSGSRRSPVAMAAPVAVMMAEQEELGDLKLYRVPEPVTVAAMSRKQVAMIDRRKVRFERVYAATFDADADSGDGGAETAVVLRIANTQPGGLGLPLPAGGVALFARGGAGTLLIAESELADRAVGEEVEIGAGRSSDLRYAVKPGKPGKTRRRYRVRVTNARATPETVEIAIPYAVASASAPLVERKGRKTWRVAVPANGAATLYLAIRLSPVF